MQESLDRLTLWISESAADRMLERIRLASDFESHLEYELRALGFSRIKVSLELRDSRLRLRQSDGGAFRLDLSIRGEFSFGLPYPDRRVDLSCAVLAEPVLRRGPGGQLLLSADFADATLRGVRTKRSSRGGMFPFDPTELDVFADGRWNEIARITMRAALRRVGSQQLELESPALDEMLRVAGVQACPVITIGDGEVGFSVGPGEAPARDPEQGSPASEDLLLRLGDIALTRFFERYLATRVPREWLRIEAPRVRCHDEEIEVGVEVLPRASSWPPSWRLRLGARVLPLLDTRGISLRLLDLGVEDPALPNWIRQWFLSMLAPRLAERWTQRSLSLSVPLSQSERWTLEVTGIGFGTGGLDVALDLDLAPEDSKRRPAG